MRQEQQSQNALQQLLANPSNLDPKTGQPTPNALAQYTRAFPKQGMALTSQVAASEEKRAQVEHLQSETQEQYRKQWNEVLGGALNAYDADLSQGAKSPDQALSDAKAQAYDQIDASGAPDAMRQRAKDMISKMSAPQLRASAMTLEQRLNQDKFKKEEEDKAQMFGLKEESLGETERYHTGELNLGTERAQMQRKQYELKAGGAQPNMTPEAINMTAEQVLAGDPAALRNIGRGTQGAADLAAIRNRVSELAADRGLSGQDLANIDAEFAGQKAGETYLGRRGAQLSQAGLALDTLITQSHDAYAKLPRGQFVPFNALQEKVRKGLSNPDELAAYVADQAVINQWAKAINPTGQLTVEATRKGGEMLSQQTSIEGHDRVLEQMRKEIGAEKGSVPGARSDIRRDQGDNPSRYGSSYSKLPQKLQSQWAQIPDQNKAAAKKRLSEAGYDTSDLH